MPAGRENLVRQRQDLQRCSGRPWAIYGRLLDVAVRRPVVTYSFLRVQLGFERTDVTLKHHIDELEREGLLAKQGGNRIRITTDFSAIDEDLMRLREKPVSP